MTTKNKRRYCVYMLRFSATGEPFYVGRGTRKRPKEHYCPCNCKEKSPKNDIINNFDTYYTIERDGLTNDEANAYEKELIALWGFENLTNKTRGGSGMDGYTPSAETRAKQSVANIGKFCGENSPMFGKSLSKETIAKISKSRTGKYCGNKNHMFGRVGDKSPIFGDNNPRYNATTYNFEHKDGRREACTFYELRTKYNLNPGNLGQVIKGTRESCEGWKSIGDV